MQTNKEERWGLTRWFLLFLLGIIALATGIVFEGALYGLGALALFLFFGKLARSPQLQRWSRLFIILKWIPVALFSYRILYDLGAMLLVPNSCITFATRGVYELLSQTTPCAALPSDTESRIVFPIIGAIALFFLGLLVITVNAIVLLLLYVLDALYSKRPKPKKKASRSS